MILDNEISYDEVTAALNEMANNKAPGCDRLIAEFYRKFWSIIGRLYFNVILACLSMGQLHLSARRGVITLIPKLGKELLLVLNWRPLTMLTIDYKIVATLIALRLKKVLPYLISDDQSSFISGRQITTTIRKTMDIFDSANKTGSTGYATNVLI